MVSLATLFCTGFNPYFNGYSTLTNKDNAWKSKMHSDGFNPYFNGYSTLTDVVFELSTE